MDFIEIIKGFFLGIIQGITEWLPISSTGHLIIFEDLLKFNLSQEFINTFFVVIQFGSILAVVVLFFNKLNPFKKDKNERNTTINLWFKIAVATIPAGIIGLLFEDVIDKLLYNSVTVAVMLIIYGVIFILLENRKREPRIVDLTEMSFKLALGIGLFQVLALIPGTSRSGATIIGTVFLGSSRHVASEFSFFLAIPIMFVASAYKLLKVGFAFSSLEIAVLAIGTLTAFFMSLWAIQFLLDYIKKHDFKLFGYYRIVVGLLILLLYFIF